MAARQNGSLRGVLFDWDGTLIDSYHADTSAYLAMLQEMEWQAACCVYVGGAPQDVEMARSAGVLAIGVIGPFPTEKRLRAARPEFLIGSLEELPKVLEQVRNGVK